MSLLVAINSMSFVGGRSFKYFFDSINGCEFRAFKCHAGYEQFLKGNCFDKDDSTIMGYRMTDFAARGKYFLATREKAPFCG